VVGHLPVAGENVSTRNPGHYMGKATILLIAVISALSASVGNSRWPDLAGPQPQASEKALTDQASAIHLTIATVGPMLGPPTDRYRVGEQVLMN
jgi:hypothetical protein